MEVGKARSGNLTMGQVSQGSRAGEVYWIGANGRVYLKNGAGVQDLGDQATAKPYNLTLNGAKQINDPNPPAAASTAAAVGGGGGTAAKVLDTAQLASLDSLLGNINTTRDITKQKAAIKRDTSAREKADEKKREEEKYNGKKLTTLQDFGGAKTETDINTRDTLENLVSSMSVLGLGGSRALTRQILDAANKSNRKANATQATNNQGLDSAFNDYTVANENDVKKIQDQFGYDIGEAERKWGQDTQTALYKKADVYNAADKAGERQSVMNQANDLNGLIANSAFVNPSYTGESRQMAVPELANYTQDIAKYDTSAIGGVTPVGGGTVPGNLAVKAIAVNDKDLGVKKKTESALGYGV